MAIIQLGTQLKVGFGNHTLTGYILNAAEVSSTGETKVIKDESNDTCTVLVSDRGTRLRIEAIITSSGQVTPPAIGSVLTIGSTAYRVEEASVRQQREESILTATVIKEDSMTYST